MRRVTLLWVFACLLITTPASAVPSISVGVNLSGCDPIDPSVCLYPFPNDHFTVADPSRDTGRRINMLLGAMPRNVLGKQVTPTEYNRLDGWSPGAMLVTKVPGLDNAAAFAANALPTVTDIASYARADQRVVVINTRTGQRHPIWTELDANPASDADRTLIIRPAVNFEEGTRYVVGLRNLTTAGGARIAPSAAFRGYRDGSTFDARRARFESMFGTLAGAGVARSELFLAWEFTVASERGLSERMLSIRDAAFRELGDTNLADLQVQGRSPSFVVNPDLPDDLPDPTRSVPRPDLGTPVDAGDLLGLVDLKEADGVRDYAPCGDDGCQEGESNQVRRRVTGQVVVPCFLNLPGCPPSSSFAYLTPTQSLPTRIPGNVTLANFMCQIPRKALTQKVKPSLYGHGLLGGAGEVGGGNVVTMGNDHGYMFCATDWAGMSTYDVPNVATILVDFSNFHTLPDRAQQGFLNFLFLGRAMIHPDGFVKHPAFQPEGEPVIDTTRLFYDGNSQGGIMGGSLTAVAPDFDRAVLGVPAMNYSTLLRRSVDFDTYSAVMYAAYPDELERPLMFSLIQTLWDRAEANGYAQHMTRDPLANTPPHEVLMHAAYGDHQVSNFAADVEARTIGALVQRPVLAPLRPQYTADLLAGIPAFPFAGSALVYWDGGPLSRPGGRGTGDNPVANVPNEAGRDPHSYPRNDVKARAQKAAFLQVGGKVVDVCGGGPCYSDGYTGQP